MPQTFHIIDPPIDLGGRGTKDCSPHIPANATGVILRVYMSAGVVDTYGLRMLGSTDNRNLAVSGGCQSWAMIGVDASLRFSAIGSHATRPKYYLHGYTTPGVEYNINAPNIAVGAGAWTVVDLSALVPVGTLGVILEVTGGGPPGALGARMNGSADNRITTTGNRHNTFSIIVGCDANRRIELYQAGGGGFFYLTGWITDGVTFYPNAVNMTPALAGVWGDLPALPSSSVAGFLEVDTTLDYDLRPRGSVAPGLYIDAMSHPWAVCGVDSANVMQGRVQNIPGGDLWLVGYAHKPMGASGFASGMLQILT